MRSLLHFTDAIKNENFPFYCPKSNYELLSFNWSSLQIPIEKTLEDGRPTVRDCSIEENVGKCQSPKKVFSTARSELLGRYQKLMLTY